LALDEQLRLISSHSAGGATGKDKGLTGFHDFQDGQNYPAILENPEIL
jgi:hypothetical protein